MIILRQPILRRKHRRGEENKEKVKKTRERKTLDYATSSKLVVSHDLLHFFSSPGKNGSKLRGNRLKTQIINKGRKKRKRDCCLHSEVGVEADEGEEERRSLRVRGGGEIGEGQVLFHSFIFWFPSPCSNIFFFSPPSVQLSRVANNRGLKNGVPPTRVVEEILMAFDPLNNHNNFHETSKVSTKLYKPKDSPKTIHICSIWLLRKTKKNK